MNIIIIIALLVIVLGLMLAAIKIEWPRFHPGWGALALAAFVYLVRMLA